MAVDDLNWGVSPATFDQKRLGGARAFSNDGPDAHKYLWVGRILHVDVETMVCSVQFENGTGDRNDIPLPAAAGCGPRSWAGSIPEKNTKVLIAWRPYDNRAFKPHIVEFVTSGVFPAREFEPFSSVDPADASAAISQAPDLLDDPRVNLDIIRLKQRKAYPGDFLATASGGADLLLDRNAYMVNRAGNEFFLRDSDQTVITQTVNEFVSNSAGTYKRGLIKRRSFNLLPDLALSGFVPSRDDFDSYISNKLSISEEIPEVIVTNVAEDSAAYDLLLEQGIITDNGAIKDLCEIDPENPFYPFDVLPDGQRISYIVRGEHDIPFSQTDEVYVEDRMELFHTSDGIQAVTEEGDGVQIDKVPPVFIESVHGTVVGNDPYTETGQTLYRRILKMRLFDDPEQQVLANAPVLEPVDTITSQSEADNQALARYYKIQSPTSTNQYAFGINKEGRVFLNVPKAVTGSVDNKGKSVDANIAGLIKAIVGLDDNSGRSIDLTTLGGIILNLGAFQDNSDPENPERVSVELRLAGKIRTIYQGSQGKEEILAGGEFKSISADQFVEVGGSVIRSVGGTETVEATSITHNSGLGGYKIKSAGNMDLTVLGETNAKFGKSRSTTFGPLANDESTFVLGNKSTTVLVGGIDNSVLAGTGISNDVKIGSITSSVTTGQIKHSVTAGTYDVAVTAGALSLGVTAGVASFSGLTTEIKGTVSASIKAPVVQIGGPAPVGNVVAGVPGPPKPHQDYLTGLPILGIPTVLIG